MLSSTVNKVPSNKNLVFRWILFDDQIVDEEPTLNRASKPYTKPERPKSGSLDSVHLITPEIQIEQDWHTKYEYQPKKIQ